MHEKLGTAGSTMPGAWCRQQTAFNRCAGHAIAVQHPPRSRCSACLAPVAMVGLDSDVGSAAPQAGIDGVHILQPASKDMQTMEHGTRGSTSLQPAPLQQHTRVALKQTSQGAHPSRQVHVIWGSGWSKKPYSRGRIAGENGKVGWVGLKHHYCSLWPQQLEQNGREAGVGACTAGAPSRGSGFNARAGSGSKQGKAGWKPRKSSWRWRPRGGHGAQHNLRHEMKIQCNLAGRHRCTHPHPGCTWAAVRQTMCTGSACSGTGRPAGRHGRPARHVAFMINNHAAHPA